MPHKRPAKPVRHVYSRDLKRRVIYQAKVLGKPSTQIAIDLDMDLRVVQRVKQTWKEIGDVCRDRKYKGRPPLMSSVEIDVRLI
jgi:transposase